MRLFGTMILAVIGALSVWYLCNYGRVVGQIWVWNGSVDFSRLDEVSVWFYRERGADGQPASPYRLSPHLSVVDPLDGPNWEVRVPGWIPAIAAVGALVFSALMICEKRERELG